MALNDLVQTVLSTIGLIFYVFIYLFVKSFIHPTFTCKPSAFLLLMRKYCRGSVFVQLAFTFSAGPGIEVTAIFETFLLKVLRTDVALAKCGNGLFFKGSR